MGEAETRRFDLAAFLASPGRGRTIVHVKARSPLFCQGGRADCIFYLQDGRVKLTVVSKEGKEGTVALLSRGDFVGEESIVANACPRVATATAITNCIALRIDRVEMIRVMREESAFSELFLRFLLLRSMRAQADLVDQLFNSSEKRLARALLLMAKFGKPLGLGVEDVPEGMLSDRAMPIPKISQGTLAEMVGTTRSRISFFMNRFRKQGFIEYGGGIRVYRSLVNVILRD